MSERAWLDRELERIVAAPRRASQQRDQTSGAFVSQPSITSNSARVASFASMSHQSHGYNGPALTDADVRRIERGEQ